MEGEDATVATEDSPRMHVDEQVWPSVYLTDVNKLQRGLCPGLCVGSDRKTGRTGGQDVC